MNVQTNCSVRLIIDKTDCHFSKQLQLKLSNSNHYLLLLFGQKHYKENNEKKLELLNGLIVGTKDFELAPLQQVEVCIQIYTLSGYNSFFHEHRR